MINHKISSKVACMVIAILSIGVCSAQLSAEREAEISKKVEELISKMTVAEKVSQMRIFHAQLGIKLSGQDKLVLSDEVKEKLKNGIAGIKNPGEHESP